MDDDPEIRDDRHIVFDMEVLDRDIPDFVGAYRSWNQEVEGCCPPYLACTFRLVLVPRER